MREFVGRVVLLFVLTSCYQDVLGDTESSEIIFNPKESKDFWVDKPTIGSKIELGINENIPIGTVLGEFVVSGKLVIQGDDIAYFELVDKKLVTKAEIDYETKTELTITANSPSDILVMKFNVGNLNDNPFFVDVPECHVEEHKEWEEALPKILACVFRITDLDGVDASIDITDIKPFNDIFEFEFEHSDYVGKKNTTIKLRTIGKVDFEKTRAYLFDWSVKDNEYSKVNKVAVTVIDMPDTDPFWNIIFAIQQFDEESEQSFSVSASDGDIEFNDNITYKHNIDKQYKNVVKFRLDKDNNRYYIETTGIDRDANNWNVIPFEVIACEEKNDTACTNQAITFIINDINDNEPDITLTPKLKELKEETFDKMTDIKISIEDKDTGPFGTYNVKLESTLRDLDEIFQIIPNNGYQKTTFSLSMINASKLDYDKVEDYREFNIDIVATEIDANKPNPIKETLHIKLKDWNDELPIFTEDEYTCEIEETFGRTHEMQLPIKNFIAKDADHIDTISYQLLGKSTNKILKIVDPLTKDLIKLQSIKDVKETEQLFDYEKQTEVIVQIEARDLVNHTTIAQVIITVTNVNDETPTLSMTKTNLKIEENQKPATDLDVEIAGDDADNELAKLKFGINWDDTYATKYGQRVQAKKWQEYLYCIDVIDAGDDKARLQFNNKVPNNTPDFEEFDTMYVKVYVVDTEQTVGSNTSDTLLVINIININDEEPVFVKDTLTSKKSVNENAKTGDLIGLVSATDKDIDSNLTYSIAPIADTPEKLVKIEENTGRILVDADSKIDADIPPTFELSYEVRVFDGKHEVFDKIKITVNDLNDNAPIFISKMEDVLDLPEHSPVGTLVLQVDAKDYDRDEPNNIVSYFLDDDSKKYFTIDKTGCITVKDSKELDYEGTNNIITVTVKLRDNPDNSVQLEKEGKFKVYLSDINDNEPIIETGTVTANEQLQKNTIIARITATDKDQPGTDNSRIHFEILEVKKDDTGEAMRDFDINQLHIIDGEDDQNGIGQIKTLVDLEGYYGKHFLTIRASDFGTVPKQQSSEKIIELTIDKYNFKQPSFVFPEKNVIHLQKKQNIGVGKLITSSGNPLQSFEATDNQGNKYDIEIKIAVDNDVFALKQIASRLAQLQLKDNPTNNLYEFDIIAIDNGNPQKHTNKTITVQFIDESSQPTYKENEVTVYGMRETNVDVDKPFPTGTASLNIVGESESQTVYYHKLEDVNDVFSVDIDNGNIWLNTAVELENLQLENVTDGDKQRFCYVVIGASRNPEGMNQYDKNSKLHVHISIVDMNTHPPEFEQKRYDGGIMEFYEIDRILFTLVAQDLDINDTLKYSMVPNTYRADGEGISTNNEIRLTETGDVVLGFKVKSSMSGFFTFEAQVSDSKNTDTTIVKIFIVAENQLVPIQFENTVQDVEENRDEIIQILSSQFKYTVAVNSIKPATDANGIEKNDLTDLTVHFIDESKAEAIDKAVIISMINEVETYSALQKKFLKRGLSLLNVNNPVEKIPGNNEEALVGWLIGVSVVLGSTCILLTVCFILTKRSLTSRLNKLSTVNFGQEDFTPNNKTMPTANRRAAEGANPVFSMDGEEKVMPDFDRASLSSTDSDLVGVENNDAFSRPVY